MRKKNDFFRSQIMKYHLTSKEYSIYNRTKKKRTRKKYERIAYMRIRKLLSNFKY